MNKVYAVMYGNVDMENEVLHTLYAKQSDAVEIAECSAKEILERDPKYVEDGFTYEMTTDSNGDPMCIMSLNGQETEYWRVVGQKVF